MNFIQPWMLAALPLIAIPIVIHLVNQRRFQTVPWAAMMFLLSATKMSSGYSKLRQWLILLMRTLAIAGLIFFTARPLASGLLGLVAGQSGELAIVLLDLSPSMQQSRTGTGLNKLQSVTNQLTDTLRTLGVGRIALFDSTSEKPIEFETVNAWVRHPISGNGLTSDVPGMLENALNYIKNNRTGATKIWICSDLRESDWLPKDGRWAALRDEFAALPQDVRIHILDMTEIAKDNLAIQITSAKKVAGAQGSELSLSFKIQRSSLTQEPNQNSSSTTTSAPTQIPVEIQVGSSRTVLNVDMQSSLAEINDFRIPLGSSDSDDQINDRGWGEVKIPGDANLADNTSYFSFETPPTRRTLIVSDNPNIVSSIELCAQIAPEQSIRCETETISASQFDNADLNQISLVVWHDQLPTGKSLAMIEQFIGQGGQLLLLPPESPNETMSLGVQWTGWETISPLSTLNEEVLDPDSDSQSTEAIARVQQWQNDSELLSNTLNGASLPVGQLGVKRICRLNGQVTALASLSGGLPLLMRVDSGPDSDNLASQPPGVYVCATTPSQRDSTLASDGVVLYIAIQRVLAVGSERIGNAKMAIVGQYSRESMQAAVQEVGDSSILSSDYAASPGVYRVDNELLAQNRKPSEDSAQTVSNESLGRIFGGLNWIRVGMETDGKSLVQEIWRWFVIAMLAALLLEAILCLPRSRSAVALKSGSASRFN